MNRALLFTALTVSLGLMAPAGARADVIIPWQFSVDGPTLLQGGGGQIQLNGESLVSPPLLGSSQVVLSSISNMSSAPQGSPDQFLTTEGHYTLNLHLVDTNTGAMGTLALNGYVQGKYSSVKSLLTNTFDNPGPVSIPVGGTLFTVSLFSFTNPGPANEVDPTGAIGAEVTVTPAPEPSTLLLLGLGMGVVGLSRRLRR